MGFSGGAETTPIVTIGIFCSPGSLNSGEKNFIIEQGSQQIRLSEKTMQAILAWGNKE